MSPAARRVVLDASAVLAWLNIETGAETIKQLLKVSVVPAPSMVEALYVARGRGHGMTVEQLHDSLLAMGLEVEPLTDADTIRAAGLIADSRANPVSGRTLSLGDGLCIAVAERLQLDVCGGDVHWETLDLAVRYRPFR